MVERFFPLKTEAQKELFWGLLAISAMSIYVLATLYFGQSLTLYFFVLVLVFIATAMHPVAGLYCILICLMWYERHFTLLPLEVGSVAYKIYPLDFCILFLFLSVGARFIEGKYKWRQQPIDWFILVFGAICSLGFISAYWRELNMALAFGTYKNYFLYVVFYFLAVAILDSKENWQKLFRWLVVAGSGLFFFLFYGLFAGRGLWSEFTPLSTSGERLIAGTHTFYLMIFFFIALSYYLYHNTRKKIDRWKVAMIVIGLSFALLALTVSLVRHLWIAMIFIFIFWAIFLPGWKLRLKYLAMVAGTTALSLILLVTYSNVGKLIHGSETPKTISNTSQVLAERSDVNYIVGGSDSSFRWRMTVWRVGFAAWTHHPFLGLGLGYEISGYDNNWPFRIALREIHNDYLAVLFQLGMIGFIAVAEWFVYLWYRFFKERDNLLAGDVHDGQLFFIAWSVILLFMVGFSISIYWDINLFVIWWWLALALVRLLWVRQSARKISYDDSSG